MMGEVYIVKKEIIENPLNFLLLDFPEIIFWVFHVNKKSSDNLFLFILIASINALRTKIK